MLYIIAVLTALVAYLTGSISGAIILSKCITGQDIRTEGSKNAGTTNMLRVHGKKAAVITLLVDVLKGVVAVLIGILIDKAIFANSASNELVPQFLVGGMKYLAAVAAVFGHDFPIYFGFKGGKGVATSLGAMMVLDWKIGIIVAVAAIAIILSTRFVSLGSIAGAVIYPCIVAAFMIGSNNFKVTYLICSLILSFLIIVKHHENISRLKNGTENKLSFKSKNKTVDTVNKEN